MTTEHRPNQARDVAEARQRMAQVVDQLSKLIGPIESAKILVACLIGILGTEAAANFMGEVVLEIDRGEGDDTPSVPAAGAKPN